MTVKKYIEEIEKKLEESLSKDFQQFIPEIVKNVQKVSLKKFIDEGDPVLDLLVFKGIFDSVVSKGVEEKLKDQKSISIIEGVTQTFLIELDEGEPLHFTINLN